MHCAAYFGKFVMIISVVGLIAGSVQLLTGLTIIPGMTSLTMGFQIIGTIAITLMGAFPLVKIITLLLKKPFQKTGALLNINAVSVTGILASLVNNIPMFHLFEKMDDRGKIINAAFMVSGAFILGDHLGFVAGVDRSMIGFVLLYSPRSPQHSFLFPSALLIARKTRISPNYKISWISRRKRK